MSLVLLTIYSNYIKKYNLSQFNHPKIHQDFSKIYSIYMVIVEPLEWELLD